VSASTFHPTFLYELIWDVAGAGLLVWLSARYRFRAPALFALYVAWYTAGRTYEETLRIDPAHHFLGHRLNFWVSLALCVAASAFFVWWQLLRQESARPAPNQAAVEGIRPSS
jgi:prolipoprotein diacylglyceryltransferase